MVRGLTWPRYHAVMEGRMEVLTILVDELGLSVDAEYGPSKQSLCIWPLCMDVWRWWDTWWGRAWWCST
jgi:hypothetical protein